MQSIYSTIDAMKKQFSQQTCPITFLAIKRRYRDKSKEIFEQIGNVTGQQFFKYGIRRSVYSYRGNQDVRLKNFKHCKKLEIENLNKNQAVNGDGNS